MLALEDWRDIQGYEGLYQVSDAGQVLSLARVIERSNGRPQRVRERVLRAGLNSEGRFGVWLQRGGHREWFAVAHLVAAAFHGPRPEGLEVCHRNGDRQDDRQTNLYYGTSTQNSYDSVRHGTHAEARKDRCPKDHPYDKVARSGLDRHGNQKFKRYCSKCHKDARARYESGRAAQLATAI